MIISFNWIKENMSEAKLTPEKLAQVLTRIGIEVESQTKTGDDVVMELGLTPNRGDCLSLRGVVRDMRAGLKLKFKEENISSPKGEGKIANYLKVELKDNKRCPRYCARMVRGVKIGPSPKWLADRLESLGVRAINNVVDATNYVMLETGQPFHAFDYRFINGGKIVVQTLKNKTKFTTLDGIEREITSEDLLICDAKGPVAVAGVMGGSNSEVKDDTKDIVLESAYFDPISVRFTSKRLGVASESSRRFERGVDPNFADVAMHKLTQLIAQIAGGKPSEDWIDEYPSKINPLKINLTVDEVNWLLGTEISAKIIEEILSSLGFNVVRGSEGFSVSVPTFRPDIERPVDLIEEIARIYGYENIQESLPQAETKPIDKPKDFGFEMKVKGLLASTGFYEAINYSFIAPKEADAFSGWCGEGVVLSNPLAEEMSVLRSSLVPSLLNNLRTNLSRQATSVRLFELRRVFMPEKSKVNETKLLSGVVCGSRYPSNWGFVKAKADFYDIKGAVESIFELCHLSGVVFVPAKVDFLNANCSAAIIYNNKQIGICGELHPKWKQMWDLSEDVYLFEINFEELVSCAEAKLPQFEELSRFPYMERDTALLVDKKITAADILEKVGAVKDPLVNSVRIFDVYEGKGMPEGKKSVAFNIKFLSKEKTLVDEEVTALHQKIVEKLKKELNAELR